MRIRWWLLRSGVQRNLCVHISQSCRIFLVTAMNFMGGGGVDGIHESLYCDDPEVCKKWCDWSYDDEEEGCYALFRSDEEGWVASPGSAFRMNTAVAAVASGGCPVAPVSVHKAGLPGYADDSDYGRFFRYLGLRQMYRICVLLIMPLMDLPWYPMIRRTRRVLQTWASLGWIRRRRPPSLCYGCRISVMTLHRIHLFRGRRIWWLCNISEVRVLLDHRISRSYWENFWSAGPPR